MHIYAIYVHTIHTFIHSYIHTYIVYPGIRRLTSLTRLNLSANDVASLPSTITQLVNLSELDVSRNKLSQAPNIQALTQLSTLNFGYNILRNLPQSYSKLARLRDVNLCMNRLLSMDDSESGGSCMVGWGGLVKLNLEGNLLESVSSPFMHMYMYKKGHNV
jgi:Leucine-rich repeat (LRR) protein